LNEVVREAEFWEQAYRDVEELERSGFKIAHGGLNRIRKDLSINLYYSSCIYVGAGLES
jgi:virulence-associated protein VapD